MLTQRFNTHHHSGMGLARIQEVKLLNTCSEFLSTIRLYVRGELVEPRT